MPEEVSRGGAKVLASAEDGFGAVKFLFRARFVLINILQYRQSSNFAQKSFDNFADAAGKRLIFAEKFLYFIPS